MTDTNLVLRMLEKVATDIEGAQEHLTELDSALGDGDHGVSMTIGFRAVRQVLPDLAREDLAGILDRVATTFQAAAGATVGALLGAGVTTAAGALKGRKELGPADLSLAFRAAADRVMDLGGARPGDKTMLDCLDPAATAIEGAVAQGKGTIEALEAALEAARAGMNSTAQMIARKGRASRLGERTRGHVDPGAASCFLILQSAVDFLRTYQ